MNPVRLAIIGATGLVGRTTLSILDEWRIPIKDLRLFASDESAGKELSWLGRTYRLNLLEGPPPNVDCAIFATSRAISRKWVPLFRDAGITVIDHSSEFRMDPLVPLVIPEVNGDTLKRHRGVVSNPNCSASVVVIPLAALNRQFGLKRVIVDTYQSVSGSGQDALSELDSELADDRYLPKVYPRRIAHNVFPQVGAFDERGSCDEESKVVEELRKILNAPDAMIFATTVRVPVRIGHSAAVTVECSSPVTRDGVESAWRAMPGMVFDSENYQTPREIEGLQDVFVGRLRINQEDPHWIQFWAVGDNLRKGAASNAVQILMEIFRD